MAAPILYGPDFSTYVRTARLALEEKGVSYQLIDVNKDYFEIRGIGYPDADIVPLLWMVNAAFDPATIHEPTDAEYKEYDTGRRYTWAHDRVM